MGPDRIPILGVQYCDNDLAEAGARSLLGVVRLEACCVHVLGSCDLGVGRRPCEVDGAGVRGLDVVHPACARRVVRVGLQQEDVSERC